LLPLSALEPPVALSALEPFVLSAFEPLFALSALASADGAFGLEEVHATIAKAPRLDATA
jgi:hypothetical protein